MRTPYRAGWFPRASRIAVCQHAEDVHLLGVGGNGCPSGDRVLRVLWDVVGGDEGCNFVDAFDAAVLLLEGCGAAGCDEGEEFCEGGVAGADDGGASGG